MSRGRDFEEERRRRQMRNQGVENVDGTFIREGFCGEGNSSHESARGPWGPSSKKPPREKYALIPHDSDEGRKLAKRGFHQSETAIEHSESDNGFTAAEAPRSLTTANMNFLIE